MAGVVLRPLGSRSLASLFLRPWAGRSFGDFQRYFIQTLGSCPGPTLGATLYLPMRCSVLCALSAIDRSQSLCAPKHSSTGEGSSLLSASASLLGCECPAASASARGRLTLPTAPANGRLRAALLASVPSPFSRLLDFVADLCGLGSASCWQTPPPALFLCRASRGREPFLPHAAPTPSAKGGGQDQGPHAGSCCAPSVGIASA